MTDWTPEEEAVAEPIYRAMGFDPAGKTVLANGQPYSNWLAALTAATRRAKVTHVSPHMFRHSAAVWMAEDGVPMREIAQFLGHSDEATTARVYAVYSPEYLRRAAKSLEIGNVRSA